MSDCLQNSLIGYGVWSCAKPGMKACNIFCVVYHAFSSCTYICYLVHNRASSWVNLVIPVDFRGSPLIEKTTSMYSFSWDVVGSGTIISQEIFSNGYLALIVPKGACLVDIVDIQESIFNMTHILTNSTVFKPGALTTGRHAWFLRVASVRKRLYVCVRMSVPDAINNYSHEMKLYWVNKIQLQVGLCGQCNSMLSKNVNVVIHLVVVTVLHK